VERRALVYAASEHGRGRQEQCRIRNPYHPVLSGDRLILESPRKHSLNARKASARPPPLDLPRPVIGWRERRGAAFRLLVAGHLPRRTANLLKSGGINPLAEIIKRAGRGHGYLRNDGPVPPPRPFLLPRLAPPGSIRAGFFIGAIGMGRAGQQRCSIGPGG
jgi:hypothetical protein